LFGAGELDGMTYISNTTIDAGLPNIVGTHYGFYGEAGNPTPTGAMYNLTTGQYKNGFTTVWKTGMGIGFDASLSNGIYGNSDTVQPNAYVVYMWKRTA